MAKKGAAATLWRRSTIIMLIVLILGFGLVFSRLFYLQVYMAEELQQKAVEQQLHDTQVSAKRGSIYDRNGKILAQSITVWDIVLAPANFKKADDETRKKVSYGLADILGIDRDDVYERSKSNDSYYEVLKRKVSADIKDKVVEYQEKIYQDYKVSGVIETIENYSRYYTNDNFAGAILGFVGADNQGLSGIEYEYDDELKGDSGRIVVAQNALNNPMPYQYEQKVEATNGYNLVLTVDETIQGIMEKYVRETIKEFNVANRGCAIMMNVKTGEILGFACEESFDPNDPYKIADENKVKEIEALPEDKQDEATSKALFAQWRNKGVSDTYIPGSVFKMVTASAVLSEGLNDEDTRFECSGSYAPYEGASPISCWQYSGHGTQTLEQALCNSCNPAFMQMGFMLGRKTFYEYFVAFGFSEKTGIDLPGESGSYWFDTPGGEYGMGLMDLAVGAFGQNFKVTPIQMVTACAAIANGGNLMQPYIVSQVVDSNGNVVKKNEPTVKRQVISEEISKQMCSMLETNAKSGGATNGYVAGYRIGGKTGTSQKKVDEYGNATDDYIASFCGIAPCNDPEIALLCYFDTPDPDINYYGSAVAGPCFRNIMTEVLPYLGIERVYSDDELEQLATTAGTYDGMSVEDAKAQAEKDGLKAEVVGSGDTVIAQNPSAYSSMPNDGTVILYTDEESKKKKVTVPDFSNCSLSDANYLAAANDLNLCIMGSSVGDSSSYVKAQDIAAGTEVEPYTVVTVVFNQDNSIM
ncbi:MAG: PASTA domain-containing protein [Clostridia bacterium]|nr:PASTA domain-containing protein [Clostridia bacterium]